MPRAGQARAPLGWRHSVGIWQVGLLNSGQAFILETRSLETRTLTLETLP